MGIRMSIIHAEAKPTGKLMATKFKEGDRVRLKSGGPTMTVNGIVENPLGSDLIDAAWFDERSKLNSGQFSAEALDPA